MANNTENLKLIISGDGRLLGAELGKSGAQVEGFARKTENAFTRMGKRIGGNIASFITSPLAGLATGAGILMVGKGIVDFDAAVMRLGLNGNLANAEILSLRKSIIDTSIASGQSRESVLAGVAAIVERTGNIKYATSVINQLAVASTATGAAVEDIGALASNLNEKLNIGDTDLLQSLDILNVQGKAGAFTLQNMAAEGERLFSAYGRLGGKGVDDLRRFGALIQVARTGTGSSEQATTAIERILSGIIEKQSVIKELGFNVFSNEAKQQFKSIDEIIKGVIVAANGNELILGKIFGEEGIRGVTTIARLYRETGGFSLYDNLVNADANRAGEIMKDFARYTSTSDFKISRLVETGKKFADIALSKPIDDLGNSVSAFLADPKKLDEFEKTMENAATVLTLLAKLSGFTLKVGGSASSLINDLFEIPESIKNVPELRAATKGWNSIPKEDRASLKQRFPDLKMYGADNDRYYEALKSAVSAWKTENKINLSVTVHPDGRVSSVSDSLNTQVRTKTNRGYQDARR